MATETKIKGLKIKGQGGLFGGFKPFGTDGLLVDMASSLDLEQELKLGGNHNTKIIQIAEDKIALIIEKYYDNASPAETKYTVSTVINSNPTNENNQAEITTRIYVGPVEIQTSGSNLGIADINGSATNPTLLNAKTIIIPKATAETQNDKTITTTQIEEALIV